MTTPQDARIKELEAIVNEFKRIYEIQTAAILRNENDIKKLRELCKEMRDAINVFNEPRWFFDDEWRSLEDAHGLYDVLKKADAILGADNE